MVLLFTYNIVCHFGTTYMDGMTGNPPFFILDIQRGTDNELKSVQGLIKFLLRGIF